MTEAVDDVSAFTCPQHVKPIVDSGSTKKVNFDYRHTPSDSQPVNLMKSGSGHTFVMNAGSQISEIGPYGNIASGSGNTYVMYGGSQISEIEAFGNRTVLSS